MLIPYAGIFTGNFTSLGEKTLLSLFSSPGKRFFNS
jgi:hypothetical protein